MDEIEVAAGIIWRAGRFLAARRPPDKPMEGYWEFPGGKLEPGETPHAALCRELGEELGIQVREAAFWRNEMYDYAARKVRVRLHFFHVTEFGGEPCSREGQELRWVTADEARALTFLPADKDILRHLPARSPATVP